MTSPTPASRPMHAVIDSPIGPLTLVAAGGVLTGLYMDRHRPSAAASSQPVPAASSQPVAETAAETGAPAGLGTPLAAAVRQLREYFAGERTGFDLPLTLAGTPFQQRVWAALTRIPYGETISYRELAARIGQPAAARAVGLANGRNPIAIIVPCHRVVGSDGSLTGYGGGLDRKQYLLTLEQKVTERQHLASG